MSDKVTVTFSTPCKFAGRIWRPGDSTALDAGDAALLDAAGVLAPGADPVAPGPDPVAQPAPSGPTPDKAKAAEPRKKGAAADEG